MKRCVIMLLLFVPSTLLFALELEEMYKYSGDYVSVLGFRYNWSTTRVEATNTSRLLDSGIFEVREDITDYEFSIKKKDSNTGGYRLNLREEGSFICNLTDTNIDYIDPDTNVLVIGEYERNYRITFLPNMMIASERIIEDDEVPGGVKEYRYVLYRKVVPPNGK